MNWTPKTTRPVLTVRIPCWPFADPRTRRTATLADYVGGGGYAALRKAIETLTPEQVTDEVKKSQLRGRGGAGFPCGLKWSFLPKPDPATGEGGVRYLAINADESEPATFKDRLLIDFDPHLVLEGIAICCYACRIQTAYFYIRGEYHHQAAVFENAIKEAYAAGIFGRGTPSQREGAGGRADGSSSSLIAHRSSPSSDLLGRAADSTKNFGRPFQVEVYLHRGAGAYICGEETALLESIEGKRGWPRNKPPFPAIKGLFGKPTIINNVETLAHLPFIIGDGTQGGADAFIAQGTASSLPGAPPSFGTKLMGVSGHVNRPGCYECDLGIPLRTLIESPDYCQGMRGGKRFKGAIAGGISMGVLGPDQMDAEMDFDIGRKYNVLGLGTACPTVFDEDTDMVAVARNIARFFKHESCGQCTPCREGSGWLYQLMCKIEAGEAKSKDLDLALEIATSMGAMSGTTICGLADGNNWAIRTIMNKYPEEFQAKVKRTFVPVGITVGAS